jgi:hypothetical protein
MTSITKNIYIQNEIDGKIIEESDDISDEESDESYFENEIADADLKKKNKLVSLTRAKYKSN